MKYLLLTLGIFYYAGISFSQNNCATAIPINNLDGTGCPSTASSTTNALASGGCEEGILDTWFQFTAQGGTADISITGPGGFSPEFLVISSSNNTCSGTFFLEGCFDPNGNSGYATLNGTINGLIPGDTYWIVVSSNFNSTGTITACVDNPSTAVNCVDNEECADAATVTLNATGGPAACVTDCNNGASVGLDFAGNGCEDQPNPTVWYEFTTAVDAAQIDVSISSSDLSNPEFTIFVGNICTGTFTILTCVEGAGGTASATNVPIAAGQTYLIAVSDVTGDEGQFDLCITQNPDNSACNTNNTLTATSTSLGSPLGGPYLPGEAVNFCYTITDWTQINCNWLGAVVPTFGDCWDPASFNAQGMPLTITTALNVNGVIQPSPGDPWNACAGTAAGAWNWFPTGSATYNLAGYYPAGTAMPAGWYFLSSYNPMTGSCNGDPTDPDNTFGDGNFPACGTVGFDYQVCFTLIAGPYSNCSSNNVNCGVTIKTFADAEFGAWTNIGCTGDIPTSQPSSLDCITPLSLELVAFNATEIMNGYELTWKTSSEQSNDYFTLEYSNDATNWITIPNTIKGSGTTNQANTYYFAHNVRKEDVVYYKLSQTDFDGKKQSLKIISIDNSQTNNMLIKTINLMGQEVGTNYHGIVFDIYSNGTSQKRYQN